MNRFLYVFKPRDIGSSASDVLTAFFSSLRAGCAEIEESCPPPAADRIHSILYDYLCRHITYFHFAHNDPGAPASLHAATGRPSHLLEANDPMAEHSRDLAYLVDRPPRPRLSLQQRLILFLRAYPRLHDPLRFCFRAARHVVRRLRGALKAVAARRQATPPVAPEVATGAEQPGAAPEAPDAPTESVTPQEIALRAQVMRAFAQLDDAGMQALVEAVAERHEFEIRDALAFCDALDRADRRRRRPVVFVTPTFPTTWVPLAIELSRADAHTAACCIYNPTEPTDTGILTTAEIPVDHTAIVSFLGHLIFFAEEREASVLVNTDGFLSVNWCPDRAAALNLIASSMLACSKALFPDKRNVTILRYDGLQPLMPDRGEPEGREAVVALAGRFYRGMMRQPNRIVYNANSGMFGDFVQRAVPLETPHMHFHRYALRPALCKPKLDLDGLANIHLVLLTRFLADYGDHTRNAHADYVRAVIEQRLHVHYYCDQEHPVVHAFRESIQSEFRDYFHTHEAIRDQQALVEDIQRYHVGLVLSDDRAFRDCVASLDDPFYRDGIEMMRLSTIPSAPFVLAGAGLPFISPRYMEGLVEVFGDRIAMPMSLEELSGLRAYLETCDLPSRIAEAEARRKDALMESHVDRLLNFLEA